ncbi:hypothetical protein LCGC14_2954380 [marine sediment metagenome]|uniref:Sec-independent protein translocase protein TatA n=1 Tax=marine sediment metagenome TaxID=412755 RepID=A0A0F8ZLZ5_9ZZZZ|nr:twin-arginine translocase TatA/TatE family subunit [Leeuwenhoekiella sp.]
MNALTIFLGMVGPWQIGIIVLVILLLFGGKKIPEMMRGLGSGIKEFKDASKEEDKPLSEEKIEEKKS